MWTDTRTVDFVSNRRTVECGAGNELISEGTPTMTSRKANMKDSAPKVRTFLD
jgi:hypothetical protein